VAPPWAAERVVGPALAAELVRASFPELGPVDVAPLGVGWDNTAYLVNGALVFRFPRRPIAVDLMRTELAVLPAIAARLPLPVPAPSHVAEPSGRFPWPFAGYPLLPGRTACTAGLDDRARAAAAEPLGRFLAALHSVPGEEAARLGAPADTLGRLHPARLHRVAGDNLRALAAAGLVADARPWLRLVNAASTLRPARATALVHGDLYARHLLVDAGGRLAGVIDWGDVHRGDPAVDLAAAHGFLPPPARAAFLVAYGPVDDETWRLAPLRALHHAAAATVYAHAVGDADLVREGLTALGHLLA
jgi:aminoglycoside phosphotransferase (APT) family kinase protein